MQIKKIGKEQPFLLVALLTLPTSDPVPPPPRPAWRLVKSLCSLCFLIRTSTNTQGQRACLQVQPHRQHVTTLARACVSLLLNPGTQDSAWHLADNQHICVLSE